MTRRIKTAAFLAAVATSLSVSSSAWAEALTLTDPSVSSPSATYFLGKNDDAVNPAIGSQVATQPDYGTKLLAGQAVVSSDGSGLLITPNSDFDKANLFLAGGADTAVAPLTRDAVALPEPTMLGVMALGAAALLSRRRKRKASDK